ncbi:MAG: Holliday junction resolvase RuvX [Dehalococcoidales bacterium]|nr:Holliday junction resolvase RuvX [Dehalococcoidales bacterium]
MRYLGLDVGDKRTGVALSDPLGIIARPLRVFDRTDDEADIALIMGIVNQYHVEHIIVGLPKSMDGSMGSQAEKVSQFAEKLKLRSPVPVEYRDERLTTVTAKQLMQESGAKRNGRNRKGEFDAAAAAVILQSFLNEARPLEYPPQDPDF